MILLVEDDVITREDFARHLRNAGHQVLEAGNGKEALALFERFRFDLVITDLVLPNGNGFGVINRIRAGWPKIPVVLISGYLSQEAGDKLVSGPARFFQKPVRPSALVSAVQRLVPA